jgi:hypothetical protein
MVMSNQQFWRFQCQILSCVQFFSWATTFAAEVPPLDHTWPNGFKEQIQRLPTARQAEKCTSSGESMQIKFNKWEAAGNPGLVVTSRWFDILFVFIPQLCSKQPKCHQTIKTPF